MSDEQKREPRLFVFYSGGVTVNGVVVSPDEYAATGGPVVGDYVWLKVLSATGDRLGDGLSSKNLPDRQ